jgi:hypothetical protein
MTQNITNLPSPWLRLREIDLCAWISQAVPGETIEYHRGFLCIDRTPHGPIKDAEQRCALIDTARRALRLYEQGLVHLVQRRIGPETFSYLAVARPHSQNAPLSLAMLLEDAA